MLADYPRMYTGRGDSQPLRQQHTKSRRIQVGTTAHDSVLGQAT